MLGHLVQQPIWLGALGAVGSFLGAPLIAQSTDTLEVIYGPRGTERVTGTLVISERFLDIDGRPALQRALEFKGRPFGSRVDTIIDFWPTIEPHRFVSRGDFGIFDVRYAERHVNGIVRDPAGAVDIDARLSEPVINASSLTAFLRTLPPRLGLRFSIRAYSPREGVFEYRGTVEARDTLTLRGGERQEALRIVAAGSEDEFTVWLDASTSRVLRLHVPLDGDVLSWAK